VFFDAQKHRQTLAGVKDAVLPAWSTDGPRLAYLQKTGRKKYAVAWMSVTLR
jgi:Tol biopolymer transport system component